MPDNLSLKKPQLPDTLDLHQVFLSNLPPNLSSSALIQWLIINAGTSFFTVSMREGKAKE